MVLDASTDAPRFRLREAAGLPEPEAVEVTYRGGTSGEAYALRSEVEERNVDTSSEEPPRFRLDGGDDCERVGDDRRADR